MNKKLLISLLACTMAIPTSSLYIVQAEETAQKEEHFNLALNQSVHASDNENGNDASKVVDGDFNTRWATNHNKGNNETITIDLAGKEQDVKQVDIFFERGTENNPQNIRKIKIEAIGKDGNTLVEKEVNNIQRHTKVVFDQVVKTDKVKVTTLTVDGGGNNYVNVGIREIEVYSQEVNGSDFDRNQNFVLDSLVQATASSQETNTLTADKVKDGKIETRWASRENSYQNEYITLTFPKLTKIQEVLVKFHKRDVNPMDSNVKAFDLIYTDETNQEQRVRVKNVQEKTGYKKDVVYQFEKPIYANKIKLDKFDVLENQYNNVSIQEIEVYSHKKSIIVQGNSLDSVVANVQGRTINADENTFNLPEVPEGYTIEFNGADFQQIIGKANTDGTIPVYHPLVDKKVNVSFNVTETKTGEVKNTGDKEFIVKGIKTQEPNKNAKPVVIPEIQEWYSDSTEKLPIQNINTVKYNDSTLKPIVDEFIKDYQNFTGITLTASLGKAQTESFSFELDATQASLGNEGYAMDITKDGIIVKSSSITGNMYGMQTILQMYKEDQSGFAIGSMHDYPRFETRGLLLDVARKPISLDMMKEITRTMRYYKMNDFQAHLSDNYIFLENYGKNERENEAFKAYEAFRLESGLTNDKGESPTAKDYFISKEEFYQFIQDERALGMKVVPEIDVPAHATSFTKVWPELMVKGQVSSLNQNRPLIDHFDLTNPKAIEKIKEIFDDYTKGENPTFDKDTTIHIGADEFLYNFKSYRQFVNDIVPYIKNTNPVRMWGGLSWIKDNPVTEINQNAIENVEMNLWSSDWADGKEMYDLGFKLINTIDDFGYMVPNGNLRRANAYGDLLNIDRVFQEFEVNKVRVKGGRYVSLPAGDDQVIGAAYAIWSDNIDKHASGLTESDLYWRFFDALPFYAEKTWAETGKEKGSAQNLLNLANEKGTGPNTNPYYQVKKEGNYYAKYDFENGMEDSSENKRDLKEGEQAKVEAGVLQLGDEVSYVTSPIEQLGNGNALSFDLSLSSPSKPGDILFEEDAPYGTHDIRVMDNGKLGFTRELYDYYFDYELPVGKQVTIQIVVTQQKTKLFVDGKHVSDATGRFFHESMVKKEGITNATFALPLERIGSKTNALAAKIDNVMITTAPKAKPAENIYHKENWTGKTNSQTIFNDNEGQLAFAFDSNDNSIWHSNWQNGKSDKVEKIDGTKGTLDEIYAEIDFNDVYKINQFSFTPRTNSTSGYVTRASLYVKNNEQDDWKLVAENKNFKNNGEKKTFHFDEQNVSAVKFVATQSNDGWVAVSEFDIAHTPPMSHVVYVEATKGGRVEGGREALTGEKVMLKAIANPGYHFEGWYQSTGKKVSDQMNYELVVNGNTSLIANFVKDDVNKSELQDLVEKAVTDFTLYTEDSVKQYQAALTFAKEVLANEDAIQLDIDLAVKKLKEAVLVKKDSSQPNGPTIQPEGNENHPTTESHPNTEKHPTTGDQTNTTLLVIFMGLSLAAFVLSKKRKEIQ